MTFETITIPKTYELEYDVNGDVVYVNGVPVDDVQIFILHELAAFMKQRERRQTQ